MKIKVEIKLSDMHVKVLELVEQAKEPITIDNLLDEIVPTCKYYTSGYIEIILKELEFINQIYFKKTLADNTVYICPVEKVEKVEKQVDIMDEIQKTKELLNKTKMIIKINEYFKFRYMIDGFMDKIMCSENDEHHKAITILHNDLMRHEKSKEELTQSKNNDAIVDQIELNLKKTSKTT